MRRANTSRHITVRPHQSRTRNVDSDIASTSSLILILLLRPRSRGLTSDIYSRPIPSTIIMKVSPITPRHPIRHLKSRIRYRLWHTTARVSVTCTSRIIWIYSDKSIILANEIEGGAYYQSPSDGSNCYSCYLSRGKDVVCRCWAGACGFV